MKQGKKRGSKLNCDEKILQGHGNVERCTDENGLVELFHAVQPLLRAVAKRYRSVSYEDAYQEACVALVSAVKQYNPELGVPFSAFVTVKVRGDVRTAMRRWWTYEQRVTRPDARDDDSPNEVWDAVMVDEGVGHRNANPYVACDTWMDMHSANLSPRERLSVLAMLQGWSSSEVALSCGVSPETVKTWRKRALRKLRNALRDDV